jgi:hypothetical protein
MSGRLSFAWWNTSLSPLGKQRANKEQQTRAVEVISYLIAGLGIDCLALGEVVLEDVNNLMTQAKLDDYQFFNGTLKAGRLQFDTGILYRKNAFSLINDTSLISFRGSHNFKVAHRIDFMVPETDKPFHIFVSHWPSRLWCERHSADRDVLGIRLRDAIEELNNSYGGIAHAILLGDFNDEPFDRSLSEQLLATRDRRLAHKNPTLLYNPFWRCLGEALPQIPGSSPISYSGSYFHKSGRETQWRTFDQIIFSSTFLGHSEWHLNEKYTRILYLEPFDKVVSNRYEIFDHFPVISVIEKEG